MNNSATERLHELGPRNFKETLRAGFNALKLNFNERNNYISGS